MTVEKKKISRLTFSNLNTQVFFFVVLPISLLLLAVTFGSISLHQDAMRNLVGERDQRTVRSAASALREKLNHRAAAVWGIAIRADDTANLDQILSSVEFLMPDFDVGFAFYSSDGDHLGFRSDDPAWNEIASEIDQQVSLLSSELGKEPIFSEPFLIQDQNDFYTVVLAQSAPNRPIAVGIFSVSSLARQTLAGILSSENHGAVILIDQQKRVLFRSGFLDLSNQPENHPGVSEALLGESGTTYFMADDGEHVVAFSPVAPTNWALVIEEPWHAVASPMLRYSETGSLVLVPIVIFALFALWFGTRKIIQPLNKFQKQANSFTHGNFDAFEDPVGGITEIQTLHSSFVDMVEQVQHAQQTLKNLLGMITTGQEEERKRLARELHDETLQSLIALNQRVMIINRQANDASLQTALMEIEKMIGQTMQELRRLTKALRPIYLEDLGLVAALETLAMETSETSKIPVHFRTDGVERRLPDHVEIAIFRITQEALSNITRHSEANQAVMSIFYHPEKIELIITDDGKGFHPPTNPADLSSIGHFGLLGIHERAELIGATIKIHSEVGSGTEVTVQIPL